MNLKPMIVGLIKLPLIAYCLTCVLAMAFQRTLLYQPRTTTAEEIPANVQIAYSGRAMVIEPPTPPVATAIIFHGNGGAAIDRMFYADELSPRGVRVVLAEFPGYGWRDGSASEPILVSDGSKLYDDVRAATPKDLPVIVIGESLGSGVATQVATKAEKPPEKLVLITPYASIAEVAQKAFWFLPAQYLIWDSFKSFEHLPRFKGKVTMVIADDDEVVGAATGRRLAQYAADTQRLSVLDLKGAQHNTWSDFVQPSFWDGIAKM